MGENRNKETGWKLSKQAKIEPRLLRQKKKMDSKTTEKKKTAWQSGLQPAESQKNYSLATWPLAN